MNTRPRTPTIADVAERAGVSITTVSHVVSGKRPVNMLTARRVQDVMSELHYVPNRAARNLSLGSAHMLGLIVPDITNTFFAELAKGAEDTADRHGYSLLVGNSGFDSGRELHYLNALRARAIDGLIYAAGAPPSVEYLSDLIAHFPIAVVDEPLAGVRAMSVISDNRAGGYLVGKLLRDLGHRTALMITGPSGLRSTEDRRAGFMAGFGMTAVPDDGRVIELEGTYEQDSAYRAVSKAADNGQLEATCLFAHNDLMAIGAMQRLRELEIVVPRDLSVVGYDDGVLAANVTPRLTTVRQPAYEMGARAANQVLRRLGVDCPPGPDEVTLDVTLVSRDSAGRAPA
ncbi:MAG: LacI family DNA-binding transcriptional regulator [Actinomycetota bacterium]|nr:LacI family DNA-binding transcriptional regulator [Actinomycetota bacterium]